MAKLPPIIREPLDVIVIEARVFGVAGTSENEVAIRCHAPNDPLGEIAVLLSTPEECDKLIRMLRRQAKETWGSKTISTSPTEAAEEKDQLREAREALDKENL